MSLSEAMLTSRLRRAVKYYEAVGSTNDAAKTWLADGAPDRAAVVANQQTRGRGRKNRAWRTPPDAALAVSVILKPGAQRAHQVNFLGALAVCDLAEELGCEHVGIKWPNDVQVRGKKIAGILPEAVWNGPELLGVVLGMGINVRVDFGGTDLAERAISLENVLKRRLQRVDLLEALLRHVDHWYSHLDQPSGSGQDQRSGNNDQDCLFQAWKRRLNMLGKRIAVGDLSGTAVDALPDGSLQVRADCGSLHRVAAGDIFLISARGAEA